MACIINAESGTGLTNSADGSGILKVQSAGKTTNALAWVNFNGTGTVAIRSSYNVSSITDNGTGNYTVNFATALSDANYVTNVTNGAPANSGSGPFHAAVDTQTAQTTSLVRISTSANTSFFDGTVINVSVFGN